MATNPLSHSGCDLEEKYFQELNQEKLDAKGKSCSDGESLTCPRCSSPLEVKAFHMMNVQTCDHCDFILLQKEDLKVLLDNIHKEEDKKHEKLMYKTFLNLVH